MAPRQCGTKKCPHPFLEEHRNLINKAAADILAVADDSGESLITVIAEIERYLVDETKVGDAGRRKVPKGRRGYTLIEGRLVEVGPMAGKPPTLVSCSRPKRSSKG